MQFVFVDQVIPAVIARWISTNACRVRAAPVRLVSTCQMRMNVVVAVVVTVTHASIAVHLIDTRGSVATRRRRAFVDGVVTVTTAATTTFKRIRHVDTRRTGAARTRQAFVDIHRAITARITPDKYKLHP